jgi:hypothetical protein
VKAVPAQKGNQRPKKPPLTMMANGGVSKT